jgi:hypothetical protein
MFVRGKRLLESFRDEDGNSRQREVLNFKPHKTPEEALEAYRGELEHLRARASEAAEMEEYVKETWTRGLQEYYEGEIPPLAVVVGRALTEMSEHPPEDFVAADTHEPFHTGYTESFMEVAEDRTLDLSDFIEALRTLEGRRDIAGQAEEDIHPLEEKITILEGAVVQK